MIARMRIGMGTVTGIALMVLALWMWGSSDELSRALAGSTGRPELECWAVRCMAIAAGAGAELLLLTSIVSAIYTRRFFDEILRTATGLLACVAVLGAMTLALMGR